MILKRRKRERANIRDDEQPRKTGHDAFVRGFQCAVSLHASHECNGRIEAHHLREGIQMREEGKKPAGAGRKHPDSELVPLCSVHHHLWHTKGCETFERLYKVDLSKTAAMLWKSSSHRIKWEREQQDRSTR